MSPGRQTALDYALLAFFGLFLFSSTFSIALSQSSLGVALILFIIVLIRDRHNPFTGELKPFYITVGIYILWMILSSAVGDTPGRSLVMRKEDWLFLIIPITVYLFRKETFRHRLLLAFTAGVLLLSFYGILQHFTGVNWPDGPTPHEALDGGYIVEGTFVHHLTYGNYFAMASCFILAFGFLMRGMRFRSFRGWLLAVAIVALVATVLSYARTAVAALPVTILFIAALRGRRWFTISLMVVVLTGVGAFFFVPGVAATYRAAMNRDLAGDNQGARVFIWEKSLAIVADHPVFGVGEGNFPDAYREQLDPEKGEHRNRPHAHNDIINMAATGGIPGALFYLAMWGAFFYYSFHGWRRLAGAKPGPRALAGASMAGGLIFLLSSVTEANFADEEVRQLLMFVWAVGLWSVTIRPERKPA